MVLSSSGPAVIHVWAHQSTHYHSTAILAKAMPPNPACLADQATVTG